MIINIKTINSFSTSFLGLAFFFLAPLISADAQCTNQLFHTSGTLTTNGVQVNVTSFGHYGIATHYCPNSTQPYLIGANYSFPNQTGGYTFQFSPAVDSVTLNFSGIHNGEMVMVFINGIHYNIPSVGELNGCDTIAGLTSTGNIIGHWTGASSGWNGTNISGPINEITVIDSIVSGGPNGAVFSIYFCSAFTTSIFESMRAKPSVYPNPTRDKITIETQGESGIEISNLQGQVILRQSLSEQISEVDISTFEKGLYILSLIQNGKRAVKKIVKN